MGFEKAVSGNHLARVAIYGPSGSGKSHLALGLSTALTSGGAVAVLCTEGERGAHFASLYNYDISTAATYTLGVYTAIWKDARNAGYGALVIDSMSQFWNGEGGVLEQGSSGLDAWAKVKNPIVRKLMNSIHAFPGHIVATFRAKTDFVEELDERGKKKFVPKGVSPVFKEEVIYEFDLLIQLEQDHRATVLKAPPGSGLDGWVGDSLDPELTEKLVAWAKGGENNAAQE